MSTRADRLTHRSECCPFPKARRLPQTAKTLRSAGRGERTTRMSERTQMRFASLPPSLRWKSAAHLDAIEFEASGGDGDRARGDAPLHSDVAGECIAADCAEAFIGRPAALIPPPLCNPFRGGCERSAQLFVETAGGFVLLDCPSGRVLAH